MCLCTWYCSSVSIRPRTATIWYCGAFIAAIPRRTRRSESWQEPRAATWRGPWLGSSTSNVRPDVRCSMPMIVREWPANQAESTWIGRNKWYSGLYSGCLPWCWRYSGGECCLSSKYRSTQLKSSGCRPSDAVGRWKSTNWQFIRSQESTVTICGCW